MRKIARWGWLMVGISCAASAAKEKEIQPLNIDLAWIKKALTEGPTEAVRQVRDKHVDLRIRFVVGKAQPLFIKIGPEHWAAELDTEDFSGREAFGRMLCPGHARNPTPAHLLIIRVDAPSDTWLHEYLHYLQAQRDPRVCELYSKMEKAVTAAELSENDLLEYEVQRWILEHAEFFEKDLEARISNMEALAALHGRLSPAAREHVERAYGWKPLAVDNFKSQMDAMTARYLEEQKLRYAENPTGFKAATRLTAALHGSISLLEGYPEAPELPLCVNAELSPELRAPLLEAMEGWNTAARRALGKPVLAGFGCASPAVIVRADDSGMEGDAVLKLGEVLLSEGGKFPALLRVRPREFSQHRWLLAGLARQSITEAPPAERPAVRARLEAFTREKERQTLAHFFAHELGHAIGLGHNFSSSDGSVMGYDVARGISEYDEAALKCRFQGKCERAGKALLAPPQGQSFMGN